VAVIELLSSSSEQTRAIATVLASSLGEGDVVVLSGDMGAGKTTFVQGAAEALGVKARVTSPTFVLMREYEGRARVVHVDVYRLSSLQELIDLGYIEIEPLTYIRGRSIPNQYMIVDEAQNLTPHEVKTIITRAGEGTKIILTGDPYQIDHPYLDSSNNGLTTVAERFKQEAIAGHVILTKGERSPLAELATQIL